MAPWTDVEKAFCVRLYTKTGSILQTQQKFRHYFNLRRCPAKNSIFRWSNKFEMFGSTENRHRKRAGQATNSGRPKTKTTPENAAIVFQSVQADHEKSIRRRSQELSLSRSSVHRILHSNLQMQSFSLQVKQRLNDQDKGQRVLMCQWFRGRLRCEPDFLDNVWFTDEAHFYFLDMFPHKVHFTGGDLHLSMFSNGPFTRRNVLLGLLSVLKELLAPSGLSTTRTKQRQSTQSVTWAC